MHGVVSLLEQRSYAAVEGLWDELERQFGVRGVRATPFPHFTYQVAGAYDEPALESAMRRVAGARPPFQARTTGLGVFTGAEPVVYVPVVRDARLSALHEAVWDALSPAGSDVSGYYRPDQWMPHITLAWADIDAERAGAIAGYLAGRSFDWEITIDNLTFIRDTGDRQEIAARVPLTGSAPA
jgi:2'-5' RNA ligase